MALPTSISRHEVAFHRSIGGCDSHRGAAAGRFGAISDRGRPRHLVRGKAERTKAAGSTADFSFCRRSVLDYIEGDDTIWEREPMERLRATANARLDPPTGSGSRWTPCATRSSWKSCGRSGKAPWKTMVIDRRSGAAGAFSSPVNRFQGLLAALWLHDMGAEVTGLRWRRTSAQSFELAGVGATCVDLLARHSDRAALRERRGRAPIPRSCFIWRRSPWCAIPTAIRSRRSPPTLWAQRICSTRCGRRPV